MRTVVLASLRTYARRYVAAAVAVIVSVAFVVVTGMLVDGARAGIMAKDGAPYRGADVVVDADPAQPSRGPACCPGTLDTADAIALVQRLGDDASGLGRVQLPGQTGDRQGDTTVGPIAAAADLRWQELVSGRFPAGGGEAVVHVWDANAWGVTVGDRIRVGATDLTVVGLVESPSTWTQASVYVTWPQYLQWRDEPSFHVGSIAVRGDPGLLRAGTRVTIAQQYVTDKLTMLNNGTDAFAVMLPVFAAVALLVSALVIANTFSILFAQRLRHIALLRCIGATRRQVVGSVRREAATVGVLASLAGTLVGIGLGYGLIAGVNAVSPATPMGSPAPPVPWLLGGFAAGLLVTMVAAWLPTRQVVRVSPLAALRPQAAIDVHRPGGRVRPALAALLLLIGPALLAAAMVRGSRVLMVAGGGAFFVGVLLVGPVLVPRLVRVAGAVLGPRARLATENAVRNPHRTATTTAALLVGVTLTTAVLTGLATWRTATDERRDTRLPVDVTLTSLDQPVTADLLDRVRRTPGVEQAITVDGTVARISGWDAPVPVVAAPDAARVARDGGSFARAEPGTIRLDRGAFRTERSELGIAPGGRVTVRVGDRQAELRVVLLDGWGQAGVVTPETLAELTDAPAPHVVWVRAAAGVDPITFVGDIDRAALASGATITDRLQIRAAGDRQLDILTWSVLGLLGISAAVALIGIANTLGLSVLERTHEHALLRSLGLTRGRLRRMLATEAVLLSVVATLLGTVIGVGFGYVAYQTVVKPALSEATMRIPLLPLGGVVVIAALAGLLASVLPSRRATKATPAAALCLE